MSNKHKKLAGTQPLLYAFMLIATSVILYGLLLFYRSQFVFFFLHGNEIFVDFTMYKHLTKIYSIENYSSRQVRSSNSKVYQVVLEIVFRVRSMLPYCQEAP